METPDTAFFLDEEAAELTRRGESLIRDIERREKELVNLRDHRDNAFRRAAEMRTAASILRDVGLRSETTLDGPFIALDYVPKRPEPTPHPHQPPDRGAGT